MVSFLKGKNILITGGSGSIGESLTKKAIQDGAQKVRVFSNDENGLYEIESKFGSRKNIEYIIGDVRNQETIYELTKEIDIIYHAAALKHVDLCELYPFEAMTVNVIGTKNIIKAAIRENVKKVILISTDKAVTPIGVMGATKLLSEKLISAEANQKRTKTVFASVRFGNVFHTRGSILPRIENQIKNGGPITLTDVKMKRFFMTKKEAVNLIILATKLANGGETFVLKMPLVRLGDLFDGMKETLAPKYSYKSSQIKTKIIGIRPGEKLVEHLLNSFEMEHVLETKEFFIIPPLNEPVNKQKYTGAKKPKNARSYFQTIKPLSKQKILKILRDLY
jgi:FlaA1/EpsC-like NDP-sugar epimerase